MEIAIGILITLFTWAESQKWTLMFISWAIYNRKILFESLFAQPIRGTDGTTHPDELAKWVLTALTVFLAIKLKDERVIEIVIGFLITGVAAIAGVQIYANTKKKDAKDSEEPPRSKDPE